MPVAVCAATGALQLLQRTAGTRALAPPCHHQSSIVWRPASSSAALASASLNFFNAIGLQVQQSCTLYYAPLFLARREPRGHALRGPLCAHAGLP